MQILPVTYTYSNISEFYYTMRDAWKWSSQSVDSDGSYLFYTHETSVGLCYKVTTTSTTSCSFSFGIIYNGVKEYIRTTELTVDVVLYTKQILSSNSFVLELSTNESGSTSELYIIGNATHKNGTDKSVCVGVIKNSATYTQSIISSPTVTDISLTTQYQYNFETYYHTNAVITTFINMYYVNSEYVFDDIYYVLAFQNSATTSGHCTINDTAYYLQGSILIKE